jgi:hypothetical protein
VVNTNLPHKEIPFRIMSRLERGGKVIYIQAKGYSSWRKDK